MSHPPAKILTHRVLVMVAGDVISAPVIRFNPDAFQAQLHAARLKFGSAICQCQDNPLPLVIRERNNKLFLACWPDQAQAHALDCPFYSATHESGVSGYTPGAITEDGPTTTLHLHHPLIQKKPERSERAHQPNKVTARGPSKFHIWGLLHHLWESGGLNRWHPGWQRDWGLVRSMLRRVAHGTFIDQYPLLRLLYIPPIWNEKRKESISENWDMFTRPLHLQHRGTENVASCFVIGIVRKIEPSQFGYSIRLQHHSTVFYMDKATSDRLASYSRRGWAAIRMMDNSKARGENPTVAVAMRIQASASKTLVIVEGALMRVSQKFIPVASSFEERLASLLVDENRRFLKPLHYDLHNMDLAHFVLSDCAPSDSSHTGPGKVALFTYGASIDPTHQSRLERMDRELATRMGCGFWMWNAAKDINIPRLPESIQSINSSPSLTPNS